MRSAAQVYWVRPLVPTLTKSTRGTKCPGDSGAAGASAQAGPAQADGIDEGHELRRLLRGGVHRRPSPARPPASPGRPGKLR
jgi:hypothetical protein